MRDSYRLLGILLVGALSAANGPQNTTVRPLDRSQRQICKSETAIGSLIPGPKRCHTAAEWEEMARAGEANARLITQMPTGPTSGH